MTLTDETREELLRSREDLLSEVGNLRSALDQWKTENARLETENNYWREKHDIHVRQSPGAGVCFCPYCPMVGPNK